MTAKIAQRKRRGCRSRKRRRRNARNKDDRLENCPTQFAKIYQLGTSSTVVNKSEIRQISPSSPQLVMNTTKLHDEEEITSNDVLENISLDKEHMVEKIHPVDELLCCVSLGEATLGSTIDTQHSDRSNIATSEYTDMSGSSVDEIEKAEPTKNDDGWTVLDTPLFLFEDWTWATAHPLFARQGDNSFMRP